MSDAFELRFVWLPPQKIMISSPSPRVDDRASDAVEKVESLEGPSFAHGVSRTGIFKSTGEYPSDCRESGIMVELRAVVDVILENSLSRGDSNGLRVDIDKSPVLLFVRSSKDKNGLSTDEVDKGRA